MTEIIIAAIFIGVITALVAGESKSDKLQMFVAVTLAIGITIAIVKPTIDFSTVEKKNATLTAEENMYINAMEVLEQEGPMIIDEMRGNYVQDQGEHIAVMADGNLYSLPKTIAELKEIPSNQSTKLAKFTVENNKINIVLDK